MSMHKIPLSTLEQEGLEKHHLSVGKPSKLSDCFRFGMSWAKSHTALDIQDLVDTLTYKQQEALLTELMKRNRIAVHTENNETTYDVTDVYDNSSNGGEDILTILLVSN